MGEFRYFHPFKKWVGFSGFPGSQNGLIKALLSNPGRFVHMKKSTGKKPSRKKQKCKQAPNKKSKNLVISSFFFSVLFPGQKGGKFE